MKSYSPFDSKYLCIVESLKNKVFVNKYKEKEKNNKHILMIFEFLSFEKKKVNINI